jgi:tetrahydromethanopterin S-methyltransferase subunit B
MKTLREYIDIVETAQRDPFDFLSNQDLMSIKQSLDSDIRETMSDRDQTIDDIVNKLTPAQKNALRLQLNREFKQRKENPQKAQEVKPVKSSMLSKVIGSILIGSAILYAMPDNPTPPTVTQAAPIPKNTQVQVIDFKPIRVADNFLDVNLVIKNNLTTPVKDIKVRCDGFAKSGTRIDRNVRVIYDVISPGQTLTVNGFDMGFLKTQVEKLECYVEDFQQIK